MVVFAPESMAALGVPLIALVLLLAARLVLGLRR